MKQGHQDVTVVKSIYSTTHADYHPVMYEIEVDDVDIVGISESSAKYIYEELGKLLKKERGPNDPRTQPSHYPD